MLHHLVVDRYVTRCALCLSTVDRNVDTFLNTHISIERCPQKTQMINLCTLKMGPGYFNNSFDARGNLGVKSQAGRGYHTLLALETMSIQPNPVAMSSRVASSASK